MKLPVVSALVAALSLWSTRASAQPSVGHAAAALTAIRIAPDHSLTAAEYETAGVPAIDHPWTHAEIEAAVRALTTLVASDPTRLPREGSPRSGVVFARLVDATRLDADTSMSMDDQLGYFGAIGHVLQLYANNMTQGFMDGEAVVLFDVLLGLGAKLIASVTPLLFENASPPIPNDAVGAGFRRMIGGLDESANGAITTLSARDELRPAARARLTTVLRARLPPITSHLSPDQRSALRLRVERIARDERSNALVPALRALAAAL